MDLKQHATEQEERVREVLTMLHNAMLELNEVHENGQCIACYINYDEQDMFHAVSILHAVCSNYAIKHGYLTEENVDKKIFNFRRMLKKTFGLDTIQEARVERFLNSIRYESKSQNNQ